MYMVYFLSIKKKIEGIVCGASIYLAPHLYMCIIIMYYFMFYITDVLKYI